MTRRPRGMFGTPQTYGTPPIFDPGQSQGEPMSVPGLGMQSPQMMDEPKRSGLFGSKFNAPGGWAEKIAAIGGTLRDGDNGQAVADYFGAQDQRAALAAQLRQASMKREQDWQDYVRKYQFELDHPKPANNDTLNDMAAAATWTPEQWAIYDRLHPVWKTGPDGLPYAVPRPSMTPQVLGTELPQGWKVEGGPGATPGNFPAGR